MLDRIQRTGRTGHGAHERLVRIPHVGINHVEMALVDRYIHRLADSAAGVVQPWRHISELDQIVEIPERAVAAPAIEVVKRTASRKQVQGRYGCRQS